MTDPTARYHARRYPFADLETFASDRLGLPLAPKQTNAEGFLTRDAIGGLIGVAKSTVTSWARRGQITEDTADRIATRIGVHPAAIWPAYWQVPTDVLLEDADRAERLAAKRARAQARQHRPQEPAA